MNKRDLIKFLEPFTDDIEIEIEPLYDCTDEGGYIKNLFQSRPNEEASSVSENEHTQEKSVTTGDSEMYFRKHTIRNIESTGDLLF